MWGDQILSKTVSTQYQHVNVKKRKIQDVNGYRCKHCGSQNVILEEHEIFSYRERYLICTSCESKNVSQTCPECGSTSFDIEPDYIINCKTCGLVTGMSPPLYVAGVPVRVDDVLLKRTQ
jgi:ribosomal protein L37AE/L43A